MPPTLNLQQNCLTAPIRLDLAVVEAMMLWPDNEDEPDNEAMRERWLNAAMTRESAIRLDGLPEPLLRSALKLASETTPIGELQKDARDRAGHGCIAGAILRIAVRESAVRRGSVNIGDIIDNVVNISEPIRKRHKVRLSKKTIYNTSWHNYRSVAHFWAAHAASVEAGSEAFPCPIGDLPVFLATAELFREAGEAAKTKQGPVLRPGETVRLPAGFVLPTMPPLEFIRVASP